MSSLSSSSSPPVAQSPLSPPNRKYISLTDDKFLPPPSPHEQAKPPPSPHDEQGVCQQEEPCEAFSIFSQSYFSDLVFVHTMSFLGAVDLVQFSRVSKGEKNVRSFVHVDSFNTPTSHARLYVSRSSKRTGKKWRPRQMGLDRSAQRAALESPENRRFASLFPHVVSQPRATSLD